jgi:hypothetical protein
VYYLALLLLLLLLLLLILTLFVAVAAGCGCDQIGVVVAAAQLAVMAPNLTAWALAATHVNWGWCPGAAKGSVHHDAAAVQHPPGFPAAAAEWLLQQ